MLRNHLKMISGRSVARAYTERNRIELIAVVVTVLQNKVIKN